MKKTLLLVALTAALFACDSPTARVSVVPLEQAQVALISTTPTPLQLAFEGQVETPPAPPPTVWKQILDMLTSPGGLALLVGLITTVLGLVLGVSEVRRRRVALGTYHAFHIVEDVEAELGPGTAKDTFDKVKSGLEALDKYMVANGWRPLKPGEQAVAKLGFTALNGASKLAEKVTANAIEAARPPPA